VQTCTQERVSIHVVSAVCCSTKKLGVNNRTTCIPRCDMHGLAGIRSTSAGVNTRCCFVNKFSVSAIWRPHPLCYGSVRRGAIVRASSGETSPQEASAKPYTNRLQTNPAYQRLKALKQQPQEAGTSRDQSFCMQGPVHLVQYCYCRTSFIACTRRRNFHQQAVWFWVHSRDSPAFTRS